MSQFRMTRYARNSPRAAGRIVALTLISNGKLQASELAALQSRYANALLGLSDEAWHEVVEELCVDLLVSAGPGPECLIGAQLIESLLADIDDAALQRLVLRLCTEVAHADGEVDDAEAIILRKAVEQWGLHPFDHELLEPLLYGLDFQVAPRGAMHRLQASAATPAFGVSFLEQAARTSASARADA
jgi:uncharacterized tellurite resistance protein B-like protein